MSIPNANTKKVGQIAYNLPDVSRGVMRFFRNLRGTIMNQSLVDGVVQNLPQRFCTQGSIQPMPQELIIKMEGEREWKWWIIHCYPDLVLEVDDRVVIGGINFRIMKKSDASAFGYLEYYAIEDYQD